MFLPINTVILQPKGLTLVKTTIADGAGNYELTNVSPGEYTLIIQSNHQKEVNARDVHGRLVQFTLEVLAGDIIQKSFEF
jgi:hypothetical protein